MIRNKYIRFFISSTFADMAKERNILQRLFTKLGEEYAKKDWQIESVDLRWGISQEAGFDNKTMQICKSEIKRCQELSPRPNFIVLLGNRYGWTPLPETIPYNIGKLLRMSNSEKLLFNKWYRLDENALPNGEYVLQERKDQYRDAVTWFDEVEYPLSQMFSKNGESLKWKIWKIVNRSEHLVTKLFGESATAQEINIGALSVADAEEHVIAYIRNLVDVPDSQKDLFLEKGLNTIHKLENLKDDLRQRLQKVNVFDVSTSYDNYSLEQFDASFEHEIEIRIRRVIEKAISEYESTAATTEDEIHLAIANEEAKDFVGRAKELSDIHQYIIAPNEYRPLWIKGKSGSGKSALLAKVIEQHRQTHHIVCRFCGRTSNTLYSWDLNIIANSRDFEKKIKKNEKPLLIVLDALNQLDDKTNLRFSSLEWLDRKHLKDIKIIVSTTDELKYSQQPPFLKIYMLSDMGIDSIPLVTSILNKAGRTLTKSQFASLKTIIDASDNSAIYLHILGHYLKNKTSWESIEDTSSDIVYLVDSYLKHLTSPERHGQELVGEALRLLTTDRIGLSDKEMLDLLSRNKYVRNSVEANSFHQIETQEGEWRLPSVLWSRLRYELSPFLRTYASQVGQVTTIFHDELKTILTAIYLYEPAERGDIASQLFRYYRERLPQEDTHALLEVIHSALVKGATANEMMLVVKAYNLLTTDLDFLLLKHRQFPQQLNFDFDEVLPYVEGEMRKKLVSLKLSLSSLPVKASNNQLLLYMYSLPTDTILYQLAKDRVDTKTVMKNIISDSEPEDSTLYVLNEVGEFPCMSNDGTKVASVFDNRHTIRITDVINPNQTIELESDGEVIELQCDDEMKYLAIRHKDLCGIFDFNCKSQIFSHDLGEHGWMSLSADGKTFVCGDVTIVQVFKKSDEDGLFYQYFISDPSSEYGPIMAGKLSPSGKVLWRLYKKKKIIRYELGKDTANLIDVFDDFKSPLNKSTFEELYDSRTSIPTCSETRVVCFHDDYAGMWSMTEKGINYWGRSHIWSFISEESPIIKISRNDQYLLTYNGYYQGPFCHIDNLNDGSAKNLETMDHASLFLGAVNGDLSIGLDLDEHAIVCLSKKLDRYGFSEGYSTGINSLTCSSNGKELAVGFGKIQTMEKKKDILRFSNNKRTMWLPPFKNNKYDLIRHVCISPDGKCIVATNIPNYNEKTVGELIYCSIDHNLIASYDSEEKLDFTSLSFSIDSRYVVTSINEEYRNDSPKLLVFDNQGIAICNYKITSALSFSGIIDSLYLSDNNRFLFIIRNVSSENEGKIGRGEYSLFDLISEDIVTIDRDYKFPMGFYYAAYEKSIPLMTILPIHGQLILTNDVTKNLICELCPPKKERKNVAWKEYRYLASTCTGRFLFIISEKHDLFIQQSFQGELKGIHILKRIQWVIPALDEVHIYAVTDDFEILLYNIFTNSIEQRAYRGPFYNYQVCALGLYIINDKGDLVLFQPDAQFKVNVPAVTTFVRRWNLKTKQQEEPTAVCPMCGHVFGLNEKLKDVLKEGEDIEARHEHWDNPQLKGHLCPHCGAQLQFNPYII